MAASSVTGVGPGSADRKNKGSEHMTLGVGHLLGTRVVAADRVTLAGGAATITFPVPLTGDKANYVAFCDSVNSTNRAYIGTLNNDGSGNFANFTIVGNGTDLVYWEVVKVGFDG